MAYAMISRFALLLSSLRYSLSGYDCSYNGMQSRSNGCTVPGKINIPYLVDIYPACVKHDLCYDCKLNRGWTRSSCDAAFHLDMKAICKKKYNLKPKSRNGGSRRIRQLVRRIGHNAKYITCLASAHTYYAAVRGAGWAFEDPVPSFCYYSCVLDFGDPSKRFSIGD